MFYFTYISYPINEWRVFKKQSMEKVLNKIYKYNLLLMKSNCLYMKTGGNQKIIAEPSKSNWT